MLYGKTGAVLPIDSRGDISPSGVSRLAGKARVAWSVGWLARSSQDGGDRVFALRFKLTDPAELKKREPLLRTLLQANGVSFSK